MASITPAPAPVLAPSAVAASAPAPSAVWPTVPRSGLDGLRNPRMEELDIDQDIVIAGVTLFGVGYVTQLGAAFGALGRGDEQQGFGATILQTCVREEGAMLLFPLLGTIPAWANYGSCDVQETSASGGTRTSFGRPDGAGPLIAASVAGAFEIAGLITFIVGIVSHPTRMRTDPPLSWRLGDHARASIDAGASGIQLRLVL